MGHFAPLFLTYTLYTAALCSIKAHGVDVESLRPAEENGTAVGRKEDWSAVAAAATSLTCDVGAGKGNLRSQERCD